MASSLVLCMARCQLRLLSMQTGHRMRPVMEQSQRWCQDDSKQRKRNNLRPKRSTSKPVAKAIGPAVSLLEKDLQDILQEQQRQEKLKARSSLQRRIDLLLSLGCTMDQIQNNVKILDLSEQVMLQRATKLKDIGRSPVTVRLLLSSCYSSTEQLLKYLQRRDELDAAICTVFQCSPEELEQLKTKHPSLNRFRSITGEDILEKSQVLYSYGITSEEIKAWPAILNIKVENIRQRLDTLKALRDEGKIQFEQFPLSTIACRTRSFDTSVERAVMGQAELDGSQITIARIAQRLGVTAKDIENASINFYKLGPSRALRKIEYLLGEGLSSADIVNHIYIMKYRLQVLQSAVEKSKSVVLSNPSIYMVLSFLRSGCLPKKNFVWSRQRIFVSSLLGVQVKDLPNSEFLRPLWSSDRLCIKRNFDFLVSEGFSLQDIYSCLALLAHDPHYLQVYYNSLWERPEVVEHADSDLRADRRQTLSLLQYVIEKDMNFTSAVFNAEVENETGLCEKELQNENDSLKGESQSQETSSDVEWSEEN